LDTIDVTDGQYVPKHSMKVMLTATIGSYLVWIAMHLLFMTCRKQVFGQDIWDRQMQDNGSKAIGAGWHRGLLYIVFHFRNINGAIMSSRSADGELATQLLKRFDYDTPRGSNTSGGHEALDEFIGLINTGRPGGLAVDAPKGPPYVSKHGVIAAAARTGAAICPFGWYAESNSRIGSWDRTMIPKPFCKLVAVFDREPIMVPQNASHELQEELRLELDERLHRLAYQTDHWFGLHGQYTDPRDIPVPNPVPLPYHPPRKSRSIH
jgi:lysophospholipid acyltransferase (LPLAT)-like uncharacterized protein